MTDWGVRAPDISQMGIGDKPSKSISTRGECHRVTDNTAADQRQCRHLWEVAHDARICGAKGFSCSFNSHQLPAGLGYGKPLITFTMPVR